MSLRIFVFTPDGFPQSACLVSAYHAGCTAVLSADYAANEEIRANIEALLGAGAELWIACARVEGWLRALTAVEAHQGFKGIVLTDAGEPTLADSIAWGQGASLEVIVQVTSLPEALLATAAGAEGLIVKGNESGGRVGEETVSILLQRIVPQVAVPVYARGGIGIHTASGCIAAGAAGLALDWQLALAEESALPDAVKSRIQRMDGSETAILGQDSPARFRAFARVGETAFFDLKKSEESAGVGPACSGETLTRWQEALCERVSKRELLAIGQDAAFAAFLADEYRTVRGICRAIRREAGRQLRVASRLDHLGENAPLARSHGTRFPILQGPMTRVSDNAEFALSVAEGGGLPFLALALMRGTETANLLRATQQKLGNRPWGVGILGFVPKELRDEQLLEVKKVKPPFVVIAGGRPDMAKEFEKDGMHVYLHVPSPELTRNFLEAGARRLIFEGRECGGHVGPRTSFVLWEQMVRVILQHLQGAEGKAEDYHIVFAGGIHDARSAAMVAAITAPLAERGVRIGILIGTGYLFTREIVGTGAITAIFQQEAVACRETVLVESGVGHATRCAQSPFARAFAEEKQRLLREGKPKEEIRMQLEALNLGRLRIASKGIVRRTGPAGGKSYEKVDPEVVRGEGMFMIGQVAALRDHVCSIEEMHADAAAGGAVLKERVRVMLAGYMRQAEFSNSDIAIVGLSCVLPKAEDVATYFQNILNKQYAIEEVRKDRWDPDVYFEKDRRAKDKIYSRWGGFIDDIAIDPVKFGMPPASIPSIDPLQLMTLEFVRRALQDAGYNNRQFNRERTCCIVGAGGGVAELGLGYGFRSMLPYFVDQIGGTLADSTELIKRMGPDLPEWSEDSFAGLLLNVAAGRVANRFDLGGTNFSIDAACATGLAAIRQAVTELETRSCDVAVVAAADMMQSPFTYLCFSKTQALSPTGEPRVFDESGDGIVVSEGIAVAILKRAQDALLDGDRIYCVLKAVGASSDGKDKGLTAPRPIGQIRAFERAYTKSRIAPETVGLVEAHGTGTAVGDRTEAQSLSTYFGKAGAPAASIALGSVKSMIGHTKCTAGMAGLIKAAMSVRHRVLPPTMGVSKPSIEAGSPMYINSETRPWLRRPDGLPRRAGVSAFGFGGTNFHVVLEEFVNPDAPGPDEAGRRDWPAELFLWSGEAPGIASSLDEVQVALKNGAQPRLAELAAAVYWEKGRSTGPQRLAIVANSLEDLASKIEAARTAVAAGKEYKDPRGIYYSPSVSAQTGKIAFVFPGQGSQSVGMLSDLAATFPEVLATFEEGDCSLGQRLGRPLSTFVFPPPAFTEQEREAQEKALKQTDVAQPALGTADLAMFRLLAEFGVRPEFACGHSYGEFAALAAAGTFRFPELIRISQLRGRAIIDSAQDELGTMAAVEAAGPQVSSMIGTVGGVVVANFNGPNQTVISGTQQGVEAAVELLKGNGIKARPIPVACAFHSPLVAKAQEPLRDALSACDLKTPRFTVFSNTTAAAHAADTAAIRDRLTEHLACPVRFADDIQAMYDSGARIFVECGPGRVLTSLVSSILAGKPHVAIQMDQPGKNGLLQFVQAMAQLAAAGVPYYAYRLFERRVPGGLRLERLLADRGRKALAPTAWIVTNGKSVPAAKYNKDQSKRLPARASERHSGQHLLLNVNGDAPAASPGDNQKLHPTAVPRANGHAAAAGIAAVKNGHAAAVGIAAAAHPQGAVVQPAVPPPTAPISAAPQNLPPDTPGHIETVMRGHHQLMSKFLETHRNVMRACLQAQGPVASDAVVASATYTAPVQTASTLPVAAAQPPAASPAAAIVTAPVRGNDSPILEAAAAPAAAVGGQEQGSAAHLTREDIQKRLVDLISQRTGYPPEMLGLDLDLEGDLGVDSIKRVEIFGALGNESVLPAQAIDGQIEVLSKLKTLRAIIDWVESKMKEFGGAGTGSPATPPVMAETGAGQTPSAELTHEAITQRLVALISQRTGYPAEMLGMDLDLEGDLGVDSIKRVEIFSALQTESVLPAAAMDGQIEVLSKLKTLRAIVGWIEEKVAEISGARQPQPETPATSEVQSARPATPEPRPVTRMSIEVVEAPDAVASNRHPTFVVITDDLSGIADKLAVLLGELGIAHTVLRHNPQQGVDLLSPESVLKRLARLREQHGGVAALVHLMPLAPGAPEAADGFEARTRLDLKSLFLTVKALERDLRAASGIVLGATMLGGTFGYGPAAANRVFAGNAAVCGFLKTLPREWPEVAARTIDFQFDATPEFMARALAAELLCRDGATEIGYTGGRRITLRSARSALGATASAVKLDRESVVLLTGGARGITASVALAIGKAFAPKIVLLGRSPLPPETEPDDISGITDTLQLKRAVMDRMQTGGQRPTPALVEGVVRRIKNEREIRQSIAALKNAGSEVDYYAVDVADETAMSATLQQVYAKYGRLDGIVHGAGVIEDKLIADKNPESFDRVIRPKISGALSLITNVQPETLQFLVFFSSVSARYGNRGQCDYAAANEVLDKLALRLNSQWPGRVVSLNWGPWRTDGGMVSPELASRFAAAGVEMIEVPSGCRAFVDEIVFGAKDQAQVVFGGPLTIEQQAPTATSAAAGRTEYPFTRSIVRQSNGLVSAEILTDPKTHGYLYDHRIDGKAVLPMVVALEMLAETAAAARPNEKLTAVRNLRNFQGITYTNGTPRTLLAESGSPIEFALRAAETGRTHYRAQADYGGQPPQTPPRLILSNPRPFPLSVPEAYAQWLFHGPKLGGISRIEAMGDNGIIARLKTSTPASLVPSAESGNWLIDPLVMDGTLQLCLLWTRAIFDQTPLPSFIEAYHFVQPFGDAREVLCEMQIIALADTGLLQCRPVLYNESGALIGWAEGVELNMSRALNRFTGTAAQAAAV